MSAGLRLAAVYVQRKSARTGLPSSDRAAGSVDRGHATRVSRPSGPPPGEAPLTSPAAVRAVFAIVGSAALLIGVVGIFVPVLPSTPFVLLAAACYARSSQRLYGWLLGQPALGPIIANWRRSRTLPRGVRRRALLAVAVTFAMSILLVESWTLRAVLAAVGVILAAFLARIPASDP
jgi:uncharacterized membrane protein YbaN (DUF454 family)